MSAEIFVPADAPQAKQAQITAVGGNIHAVEGDREAVADAAQQYARQQGIPYLSHNRSPYFSEGMKQAAEEISEHGLPDAIVLPVGNGSLLIGLYRGFRELIQLERIERMPRLYAIQSINVGPVAAAFRNHEPGDPQTTIADGIAVSKPPRLAQMLEAVRESGGTAERRLGNRDRVRPPDHLPTRPVRRANLRRTTRRPQAPPGTQPDRR